MGNKILKVLRSIIITAAFMLLAMPALSSMTVSPLSLMGNVVCEECHKADKKSRVYVGVSTSTLLYCPGYYDEEGNHVSSANCNTVCTTFNCSNGHEWTECY